MKRKTTCRDKYGHVVCVVTGDDWREDYTSCSVRTCSLITRGELDEKKMAQRAAYVCGVASCASVVRDGVEKKRLERPTYFWTSGTKVAGLPRLWSFLSWIPKIPAAFGMAVQGHRCIWQLAFVQPPWCHGRKRLLPEKARAPSVVLLSTSMILLNAKHREHSTHPKLGIKILSTNLLSLGACDCRGKYQLNKQPMLLVGSPAEVPNNQTEGKAKL